MPFDQSTFAPVSAHAADSPSVYSYNTTDSLETVLNVGYFNDKKFQLEELDLIDVTTSQGTIRTQVTADTSTVDVHTNAIVAIESGRGSVNADFNSPNWERSTGIFQLSELGSAYSNAPFVITQPSEVYKVIVKTDKGSGIIKQLMTVVDPNGLETRFFRARTPESLVIGSGWSQLVGGLSDKGATVTTDNVLTPIFTYGTENDKTYSVEFSVTASKSGLPGSFGGKYFMLLENVAGTVFVVGGLETIYRKRSESPLAVSVTTSTKDATINVLGKTSQTWNWFVSLITFEVVE